MLLRSLVIGRGCIYLIVKYPKVDSLAVDADSGLPTSILPMPRDAAKTGRFVSPHSAVGPVLRLRCDSQVLASIIETIAIDVVGFVAVRGA